MVVRGLAALLTLTALAIGLPLLLYRLGGSPIPARLPTWHRVTAVLLQKDNGSLFLGAVKEVSWIAWAAFVIAVLTEAQATLRGRQAPRLHLAGLQGAASRLVASAALTFSTPAVLGVAVAPAVAATAHAATPQAPREPAMNSAHKVAKAATERMVVVQPGDCLWTIAQRYLGSGERFTAIARLNLGQTMPDGQVFTNPSIIRPGWQLRLPAVSTAGTADVRSHAALNRVADRMRAADRERVAGRARASRQHPPAGHTGHPSADPRFSHPHHAAGQPVTEPAGTGAGSAGPMPAGQSETVVLTAGSHQQIPEFALFTLGMLAGGVLASLERLRHRQRQHRRAGRRITLPQDEEGQRVERKLRAAAPGMFARLADDNDDLVDVPDAAEADQAALPASMADALRDLSEAVAASGDPLPPIVGVHLTATTLEVLLSAPASAPPPAPFTIAPARQAMCWTVDLTGSRAVPPTPGEVGDLLPGLFTAGATDAGGYLLLDLEAMRVTCCDGPDDLVDRLLVTAATELASSRWSGWYDLILVGCDELDILGRAELCSDLDDALDLLEARARAVDSRLNDGGSPEVRSRRLTDPEDEDWGLSLVVSRLPPTPLQMERLLDLTDGPGGIAALVAGDIQAEDGKVAPAVIELAEDPDRPDEIIATVSMAYLGPDHRITVRPQTLTVGEYEALAGVFATAADTADVDPGSPPYDDHAEPPWIRLAAAPVAPVDDEVYDGPGAYQDAGPRDWDEPSGHQGEDAGDPATSWTGLGPAPAGQGASPWTELRSLSQVGQPGAAARGLEINVLGPVEIVGSAEPLQPKQAELVLALALHAPVGLSNSALCTLLGADADHPRPTDSVRQLITRARRRLGRAPDGQEYIIHLGSGIYVLHADARLDWTAFRALATRGRSDASAADLHAALAMVRGQPFADCYHWWIDIGLIETMRAEIVDAADLLANLELTSGDPRAAAHAARAGLAAESAAEQLWRALMCAEHDRGNLDGVTDAWHGCLDAISEIAPGADPHPDTERLYRQLTRDAVPAGLRY